MSAPALAFVGNIGMMEMVVIGAIALLIFGKRLPEVGRSIGRGLMEFKRGLSGVSDEINATPPPSEYRPTHNPELDRPRPAPTAPPERLHTERDADPIGR